MHVIHDTGYIPPVANDSYSLAYTHWSSSTQEGPLLLDLSKLQDWVLNAKSEMPSVALCCFAQGFLKVDIDVTKAHRRVEEKWSWDPSSSSYVFHSNTLSYPIVAPLYYVPCL